MKATAARSIISVNPFRCRMWPLHDRLETHVSEETCRVEIESFLKHGQLVPVLGRALRGDPDYDVELIFGARRLFVARHINRPLAVELREMSDREAIVAMDIENRQRLDISPYERGLSYARWLRGGHFRSQDDLARDLKVSSSQVSRMLKLARLPSAIVSAFNSPADICEGWGLELMEALDDPQRREATLQQARQIAANDGKPPCREVYRQLLAASAPGRRLRVSRHDEVVRDTAGAPLFRIRHQRASVAVLLPVRAVSADSLQRIRVAITAILHPKHAQAADSRHHAGAVRDMIIQP